MVESKTAAMFEHYAGGGGAGTLNWSDEDLFRTAALYDREGFQIFFHAIGDRAIDQALRAYEHAAKVNGTSGRRHRIEHIEVPRLADLAALQGPGRDRVHAGAVREPRPEHPRGLRGEPRARRGRRGPCPSSPSTTRA